MTDPIPPTGWQTLIIVLPSILAFLTASLAAVLAYLASRGSARNAGKIDELHILLNSRLDALVKATQLAARAEGLAAGLVEGKSVEQADQAVRDKAR
jgi:hypothetical protein